MSAAIVARLRDALVALWAEVDLEQGVLPPKSCRWLLKELQEIGQLSTSHALTRTLVELRAAFTSTTSTFSLQKVADLAALLGRVLLLLAAALPAPTARHHSEPALPYDVLSLVLHEVASHRDRSTLASVALAGKALLPLARKALYRNLEVGILPQWSAPSDRVQLPQQDATAITSLARLSASVVGSQSFAATVRSLAIHSTNELSNTGFTLGPDFWALLAACRPREVTIRRGQSPEVRDLARKLKQNGQRVQRLSMDDVSSQGDMLWRMLEEQDQLKSLELIARGEVGGTPGVMPCQLVNLSLFLYKNSHGPTIKNLITLFTAHSTRTLRHIGLLLNLSPNMLQEPSPVVPTLPHLQHLTLAYALPPFVTRVVFPPITFDKARHFLSQIPSSVTHLTFLESPGASPDTTSQHLAASLFKLHDIPSSITHLDISALAYLPADIIAFLRERGTQLRGLSFNCSGILELDDEGNETGEKEVNELLKELGIEGLRSAEGSLQSRSAV